MKDLSASAGLEDAVVVNTCAVTAEAVRKSKQAIRKLARQHPGAPMIATGCAVQIEPESFASMGEVDAVVGNGRKLVPDTWRKLAASKRGGAISGAWHVDEIMSESKSPVHSISGFGGRARGYVQVQNGCDHRCTFCIIPFGRGNSRSVPVADVVEQVKSLVGGGFNEVVLTGVDLTSWGEDLAGGRRLGDLVAAVLASAPDLPRLRISSIDPVEADSELMGVLASEKRLMPHLHLSLQSGDNMILKRMKRRHSREEAISFCEEARRLRPEIAFGADLIAGISDRDRIHVRKYLSIDRRMRANLASRIPVQQAGRNSRRAHAADCRRSGPRARDKIAVGWTPAGSATFGRSKGTAASGPHGNAPAWVARENFAEVEFSEARLPGRLVEADISARTDTRATGFGWLRLQAPNPRGMSERRS